MQCLVDSGQRQLRHAEILQNRYVVHEVYLIVRSVDGSDISVKLIKQMLDVQLYECKISVDVIVLGEII